MVVTTVVGGEQVRTRASLGTAALALGSCVAGIPVKLHYTFFLLLLLEVVSSLLNFSIDEGKYPMYIVLIVILYGPILLITILVHEFGHALMNKRLGGTVDEIVLWPLGGFAICGPVELLSGDLKVALAGPATHIPMILLWWVIYLITKGGEEGLWPSDTIYLDILSTPKGFFEMLSSQAVYMNIILFCFNLLIPAYPLGVCVCYNHFPFHVFTFIL